MLCKWPPFLSWDLQSVLKHYKAEKQDTLIQFMNRTVYIINSTSSVYYLCYRKMLDLINYHHFVTQAYLRDTHNKLFFSLFLFQFGIRWISVCVVLSSWRVFRSGMQGRTCWSPARRASWGRFWWRSCCARARRLKLFTYLSGPKQDSPCRSASKTCSSVK